MAVEAVGLNSKEAVLVDLIVMPEPVQKTSTSRYSSGVGTAKQCFEVLLAGCPWTCRVDQRGLEVERHPGRRLLSMCKDTNINQKIEDDLASLTWAKY